MARIPGVTGVNKVFNNMKIRNAKTVLQFEAGLLKAGLFVQAISQAVVPVKFGILKNSAFTRPKGSGASYSVLVGYTASYAIYVHENLEARHKPGKIAKFLEQPMRENADKIVGIVAGSVKP